MSVRDYFNPFQTSAFEVPQDLKYILDDYVSGEESIFSKMLDVYIMAVALGAKNDEWTDPKSTKWVRFVEGAYLSSNQVSFLYFSGLLHDRLSTDDIGDTSEVLRISKGYVQNGLIKLETMIREGSLDPIINVTRALCTEVALIKQSKKN